MTYLLSLVVLILFFFLGNFLSNLFGRTHSLFSNLWLGLITSVFGLAIVYTGFSSIFIGVFIILGYFFIAEGVNFKSFRFDLSQIKANDVGKTFVFFSFFYVIFYLLGGQSGSGQSLHHDFLFYIDVSWHLEKTGVESLVMNPIDSDLSFPSGYHYFIPWLILLLGKLSFGSILSYNLLLNAVFPILSTVVFCGVVELAMFLGLKSCWRTYLLSLLPFLTFGLYLPFYADIPLLEYGDRFIYGVFNSYWSGKILVSSIILIPLFKAIMQKNAERCLINLGLLSFVSMVNLPISLILMLFIVTVVYFYHRSLKNLIYNLIYLIGIFMFFQFFYNGDQFIPVPHLFESLSFLFLNIRSSILLIAENLIQCLIIFLPLILALLFFLKVFRINASIRQLTPYVIITIVCSSVIWILFRNGFGSSEFYKLVGITWINLYLGLLLMVLIDHLLKSSQVLKMISILIVVVSISFYAFFQVNCRVVDSYSSNIYSEILTIDLEDRIVLSFESEKNKYFNIPGQLNPFVHYNMDVLYQTADHFSIISGSGIFSNKFSDYIEDEFAALMLKQDPLYMYSQKFPDKEKDELLLKFIDKYNIQHFIFDEEYEIPNYLLNEQSRILVDDFSKCKLLING